MLSIALPTWLFAQTPTFGQNINMVTGTDWTTGDPFLQRQNEPSIAVSTRNNLHLMAGDNDYRSVDLPGILGIVEQGDAWLGVFKSFDGGLSWKSTLLPGFPLDSSPTGLASPLHGFQASADPTVRSGPSGIFYYSGIAFNRTPANNALGAVFVSRFIDNNNRENGDPTATSGGLTSVTPTDPVRYLGATIISTGTSGQFLDKPWLAVDIPRNTNTCTINFTNPDGTPGTQTIPAARVFLSYSTFTGTGGSSKIVVAYSDNCGATFPNQVKISQTSSVNQGTIIAVDPSVPASSPATVYVAWRRFANGGQADAIVIAKSTNGGATWGKAVDVIDYPVSCATNSTAPNCQFDQDTTAGGFRTNTYPALAVDATGRVYVAAAQRNANGDARIMMTVSVDGGSHWSTPSAVDSGVIYADDGITPLNLSGRGHQIMPSMSFNAGKLTLIYYDTRQDHTIGVFTPAFDANGNVSGYGETRNPLDDLLSNPASVFNPSIDDATLTERRHTIDVQAAQVTPPPAGQTTLPAFFTFRVARYFVGFDPTTSQAEQLGVDPPGLPMFVKGSEPFIGDYIDVAGDPPFVLNNGKWGFNVSSQNPQVFHATWTDNRDVVQPPNGDWTQYVPPFSNSNLAGSHPSIFDPTQIVPQCQAGTNDQYLGTRNQNIYTARIEPQLIVSSPGNQKTLGFIPSSNALLQRAFPLYVRNNTNITRYFRLMINNQPLLANGSPDPQGQASFQQSGGIITQLDVTIPQFSNIARSVFVQSANPAASVNVSVFEITTIPNGVPTNSSLNGSLTFNPDPNAPQIINPDGLPPQDPPINLAEAYTPTISPVLITNPMTNDTVLSPLVTNPAIKGNYPEQNPAIKGNTDINPAIKGNVTLNTALNDSTIYDSSIANAAIQNQTINDALYTVTNTGNTSATYAVKLFNADSTLGNLPGPLCSQNGNVQPCVSLQLILAKQYLTPTQQGCSLAQQNNFLTFANVQPTFVSDPNQLGNPNIFDPTAGNATLALAPGETGFIILRGNLTADQMTQLAGVTSPVVVAHAANTGTPNPPATLAITSNSLPVATVNQSYNAAVTVFGGVAPYNFSVITGSLPPGLQLDSTTGAFINNPNPTSSGDYTFTVKVTDSAPGTANAATQMLTLHVSLPLAFTSNTLPDAIIGLPYSATFPTSGGTSPFTFSLGSPLPSGLTFDPAGTISGTPDNSNTAGAVFSLPTQVQDSGTPPQSASTTLTMRTLLQLSAGGGTTTLPDAIAGQQYSANLTATGGTGSYSWSISSGSLPSNLTLDSAAGSISGIPQASGSSSFTVTVQDQSNPPQSSSSTVNLTVANTLKINTSSLPDGVVGTNYSQTLSASGGTGTLTWTATGVPGGLMLSSSGVLSGVPNTAVASTTIMVQVKDSGSPAQNASASLNIHIALPLQISAVVFPDGVVGVPYSQALSATGGTGSATWTLIGSLPAGLSLSPAGVISGTPTAATTGVTFNVKVQDSGVPPQVATSQNLTIRVGSKLTVTTTSLANGNYGVAYSQALTATGGLGTYAWSLAAGSGPLPTGLSLSSAGVISGTPTAFGSFPVTVQVQDASAPQQTATQPLTLTVSAAYTVVFSVQPSNTSPGSQITPSVKVVVTDSKGRAVRGAVCQASLAVNPGNAVLTGTTATTGNNGVAVFASQSVSATGIGYQMLITVVSPAGGGSALSVPFNVR